MIKMRSLIFIAFILLFIFACSSNSSFIGYQDDCLGFQSAKVDSVFRTAISSARYLELSSLNKPIAPYKILVIIDVNTKGYVKNLQIRDSKKFLLESEKALLFSKISNTKFSICLSEPEHRHLPKEVVFKNKETIQYGLVVPYTN